MMKFTSVLNSLLFFAIACSLVACGQQNTFMPSKENLASECIPPYSILALPVGNADTQVERPKPIPPINWDEMAQIPESSSGITRNHIAVQNNSFWVNSYQSKSGGKLLKYAIDTKRWKAYESVNNYQIGLSELLVTHDDVLWSYYRDGQNDPSFSFLSRYNGVEDQFEVVSDTQGVFKYPSEIRSNIVEDAKGLLWLLINTTDKKTVVLYSFNPYTLESKKQSLQLQAYGASITLGQDGRLWIPDFANNNLWSYDVEKNEAHSFHEIGKSAPDRPASQFKEIASVMPLVFPYADRSNRLWLENMGWLDVNNSDNLVFYSILSRPEFVEYSNQFVLEGPQYALSGAKSVYQSTNGAIWFTTDGGVVRLKIGEDYRQGEWCRITNGSSDVVEDSQGNLWMVVFDKLYKYKE